MSLAPAQFLRRERVVIVLALAGVTAIAWLYLVVARQGMDMSVQTMGDMPDMAMPFAAPWVFAMWWVMMAGHDAAECRTDDPDVCGAAAAEARPR